MPTYAARAAVASAIAAVVVACSTAPAGQCDNGVRDADETGVDCGGLCGGCRAASCTVDSECASDRCQNGLCAPREGEPDLCSSAKPCQAGEPCKTGDDCIAACVNGTCTGISDSDGKKNQDETDIDCGGPIAKKCGVGKTCVADTDCGLTWCNEGSCGTPSPSDDVKNGTETDVDCGGEAQSHDGISVAAAARCNVPKNCLVDPDCTSTVCADNKVCTEAQSCRPVHGGQTCGAGEFGQTNSHESCCKSFPVPGMTMMQGGVQKQVYLDKYEITAGRIRTWVAAIKAQYAGVPNIQGWVKTRMATDPILASQFPAVVAAQKPPAGPPNTADYLPAQATGQIITLPVAGGLDFGLQDQIGPTSYYRGAQVGGSSGCGVYAGAYGHRTYWFTEAESTYFGEPARPPDQKDWLDEKSMNCLTVLMYAAFCAWDGGYLETVPVMQAAWGGQAYPWGAAPAYNDNVAKITNYNAGTGSFTPGTPPRYNYPPVNYATYANDFSPIIAAPGRFPGDIGSVVRPGQESWMDLGGNMLEWLSGAGTYYGWSGYSFEGHAFGRSGNIELYFLDKYGKATGRCMRLK